MRVLHISEVSWGGVISLIRHITAEQTSRGHEVCLLAPQVSPAIQSADLRGWSLQRDTVSTYPAAVAELRAVLADFRPDVIHLHSFMAGFVGRLPLLVGSVPIVYQPHAWSFELKDDTNFGKAVAAWERFAGRRTDVLVTNCQDEIDEGHSVGITTPGRVLGVAVDTKHFSEVDETVRQRSRKELEVKSPRMLLCIGRLARQKGQDLLVAAWEREPLVDTELVLVGPGDSNALRALAPTQWGHSIRAVGEDSDVRRWLWACDALVLPSRYETVAVAVAEALACGRPVIATNVNGVGEVLRGGGHPAAGRVVPVGDMKALLAEAEHLLESPESIVEMSAAGRLRAEALFSPEGLVDRLDAAYAEAIAGPSVPRQRTVLPMRSNQPTVLSRRQ